MPASWQPEALKAQAVAARTYATWSRDAVPRPLLPDLRHLLLPGVPAASTPRTRAATRPSPRPRGRSCTYGGSPRSPSSPRAAAAGLSAGSRPYLVAKADPYDDYAGNPVHDWTLSAAAPPGSQGAYPGDRHGSSRLHVTRRDGHGEWGGRVVTVVLDGSKRNVTISGDTFRVPVRPALQLVRRLTRRSLRRVDPTRLSAPRTLDPVRAARYPAQLTPGRRSSARLRRVDGLGQARTSTRSPPSTCWVPPRRAARRCRRPAR